MTKNEPIGFIGQGYVGKNYADNFEERGLPVIRYALEEPYARNKEKIKECGIVFVAVPTPTTPKGFDVSIVRNALEVPAKGSTVVIKSTVLIGMTQTLQKEFPELTILFSPEFLSEKTARADVDQPFANVIGLPNDTKEYKEAAERVMKLLPVCDTNIICTAEEAELTKYAHNTLSFSKTVFMNILYEAGERVGADWEVVKQALAVDPIVGSSNLNPVHKGGRGAGGNCLIKDFEAFLRFYQSEVDEKLGAGVLLALRDKNLGLLKKSEKDQNIVRQVYGNKA